MTENPQDHNEDEMPPGPKDEPGVRKLTRSSSDKLIGGVAGGLGRYFNVDPILFRVAFVVLSFAGGVGILAYIALLAFVPADDGSTLGRGSSANVAGVVLVALVALVILGPPAFFLGPVLVPIALVLGIGMLLWRASGGTLPSSGDPGKLIARGALAFLVGLAAIGAFAGVFLLRDGRRRHRPRDPRDRRRRGARASPRSRAARAG